jgi:hypothetical protein
MRLLKKIAAAGVLLCVLSLSAFPCALPEPGQTDTPPCAMAPAPDPGTPTTVLGQIETPPAAQSDASFTEIAASVLVGIMSLF